MIYYLPAVKEQCSLKMKVDPEFVELQAREKEPPTNGEYAVNNYLNSEGNLTRPVVDENREQWSTKVDFMLSIIGYCVGLGNVWR